VLRGWVDLTSGREAYVKRSLKAFEDVLQSTGAGTPCAFPSDSAENGKVHVEAALGKAAYLQDQKRDHAQAVEVLNTAIAAAPNFLPALIEKAKVRSTHAPFLLHCRR
jgi:tetratricopeptide repeat protein 21B